MNMPSFHQDDFIAALAARKEIDLEVIFAHELTNDRRALGWEDQSREYPHVILRKMAILNALRIAARQKDRVHVVNGIWAEPAFSAALTAMFLSGCTFVIHTEAPDPSQPRTYLKRRIKRMLGAWVARRASGVFAVSSLAADYCAKLGFRKEAIYPFGYFRAPNSVSEPTRGQITSQAEVEIVFVGQLIGRKGIDTLLEAIFPLLSRFPDLSLRLVGDGPQAGELKRQALELGVLDRIRFEGVVSSALIESYVSNADLLVLPSRWDGWGMVVNEALSLGVPVIVSDRCGAADLVRNGTNGYVFRSGDALDLRQRLSDFMERRFEWPHFRAAAAADRDRISAEAAASYFIDCLMHATGKRGERPTPPWVLESALGDVARSL
jgi:glycosyltransferase involved in cell wall biosynthesis